MDGEKFVPAMRALGLFGDYHGSIVNMNIIQQSITAFMNSLAGLTSSQKRVCLYFNAVFTIEVIVAAIRGHMESAKTLISPNDPSQQIRDYAPMLDNIRGSLIRMAQWLLDEPIAAIPGLPAVNNCNHA